MLTLKAGILMYEKNNIDTPGITGKGKYTGRTVQIEAVQVNRSTLYRCASQKAFTFVEVLVALVIVSISLLALIKLHLLSINMTDSAQITSHAVFLAEEKIAEKLAAGYPEQGTDSGTMERGVFQLYWKTVVTDLHLPQLQAAGVNGLRKILVDVSWNRGTGQKHLQMSTYVADRKLQ